jgi:hypothetical protein
LVQEKRRHRNPTRRFHPYFTSAPEMADLLNWCPPDGSGLQGIFRNSLPWDLRVTTDGWGEFSFAGRSRGGEGGGGVGEGPKAAKGTRDMLTRRLVAGRGAKAYREAHRGEALLPDTRWLEVGREKD